MFLLVHATGVPCTVPLVLSLLVDAGCNVGVAASDVGDVGIVELEELVDKPGTTMGTLFSVLHCIRLPLECVVVSHHWSTRRNILDLRRVFQVRELLVYLRDALLSKINPIL